MKKSISTIFALCSLLFVLTITSCKGPGLLSNVPGLLNKVQTYIEKNCPKKEVTNPITGDLEIHYQCDSVWATDKITAKCDNIKLCVDITKGSFSGDIVCKNLIPIPAVLDSVLR